MFHALQGNLVNFVGN